MKTGYREKWIYRITALAIVMSMLCAFLVPIELPHMELAASADGAAYFENVQTTPLGDNLSGKITGVSVTSDGVTYSISPITIPNVSASPHEFTLSLGYRYDNAQLQESGILDSHCVYYQIPPNTVNVKQDYFGSGQQVIDSGWSNEQPSGYFSISQDGLIVIRFTDDYISYLRSSQDGFNGTINFKVNVERSDTADGDYTFTLEGQEVTFEYPDDHVTMTKDGWSNRDENGQYIEWRITINNPSGHFDLSEFTLNDVITDNGTAVDLSTVTDVTVTPSDAAVINESGFTLTGNPQQVTISYKQPAQSGHTYENEATLQKGDETPITARKEVIIVNALEANKTGTPDYNIPGQDENGQVLWTINVHNKSGDSLDQTKITDAQFPSDKSKISVYYYDNANQKVMLADTLYTLDAAAHALTLSGASIPSRVYVEYYSKAVGSFVDGKKTVWNSYSIESTKTDNPPEETEGNPSLTYEHQYTLDKGISQTNTVNNQVQWKIVATANMDGKNSASNATLNGYEITDPAFVGLTYNNNERNGTYISFNAFTTGGVTNITDQVELVKDSADSTKVTIRLKNGATTPPITRVELFYLKDIEDCVEGGTAAYTSYQNGDAATVSNSATGEKPGTGETEGTGPVTGTVQKRVQADKIFLSNAHEKVIGNADKKDRILDWKVNLVNDSGFLGSANAVVDVLESTNGGQHYIAPAQAANLRLVGKTSETGEETELLSSYYTVRYYDASGNEITDFANGAVNAVHFEVNFSDDMPTNIRFVTISYKTTADVSGVPNGSVGDTAAHFGNTLTYQGEPQTKPGLTFEREDPNDLKYIHFNVQKTWDDNNNKMNMRPTAYQVKIYRAEADADGLAPAVTDTDAWTLVEGSGATNGIYTFAADQTNTAIPEAGDKKDFPQWVVKTENGVETVVRYYYRIEEVITEAMTEGQYTNSSTSAPILARNDNETFRLTNKKEQDVMKYAMDTNENEIQEIDLSKVPKVKMSVGGVDTYCYIFGWKIYFKEGATKYTDTLPNGAIYISGSEDGMSKYVPKVIQSGGWETRIYDWAITITASGSNLAIDLKNTDFKILKYYTAIPASQIDTALQGGLLINSVKVDGSEDDVRASLTVNKDIVDETEHLEKGTIPTIVGGTIKYFIDVNPTAKRLSNDGYVTVTDYLSFDSSSVLKNNKSLSDLNITLDDVKVYPYVNGVLNKVDPITDFSYTVDYDVTEEKQLSYQKTADNLWEIQGWSVGEEIEATILQNEAYSSNVYISAMRPDSDGALAWNAYKVQFPDYTDSKSTVSFTVPELIFAGGNNKAPSRVVIYDNGRYNGGNPPYTMAGIESVKSIKTTPAVLHVDIPDQQYVRIEYTYRITGYTPNTGEDENNPNGDKIYLNNTASFHEDNGEDWDTREHTELNVKEASATSEANRYPKIYKVDVNNFAVNTLAAKFKVAKYDEAAQKWVYASQVTSVQAPGSSAWHRVLTFPVATDTNYQETTSNNETYAPTAAADLVFAAADDPATVNDRENVHEFVLSEKTLYKFVEIEAPEGYTKPVTNGSLEENSNFVFYYAYNGYTGEVPADAMKDGKSLVRNVPEGGTLNIPNTQPITIQAQKLFTGDDNDLPDSAAVTLKLYYSKNRNGTNKQPVTSDIAAGEGFENPVVLNYTSANQEPVATWTGLPSGMGGSPVYYFVEEEAFSITKGGTTTTYTYNSESKKFEDGSGTACKFQPVYTRNGSNADGTVIQVNNSEGILVKKSWLDRNGKVIEPAKTEDEPEGMAVAFEIYARKGGYQVKLDLTAEQSTLNPANGYKLFLPQDVKIVEPTSAGIRNALEYTDGKTYPLSYFDKFIIEEKLTPEQSNALYGKYGTPKYKAMIDNGTGILELINTDIRTDIVNLEAEKIWDDNDLPHTGDSITLTLVQSTSASLTSDDLIAIAGDGVVTKDHAEGSNIRSSKKVLAIAKGSTGSKDLGKAIQEIAPAADTAQPVPFTYSSSGSTVTGSDTTAAGSYDFTVTFTDGTQQDLKITVFEPTVVLNESNQWQAAWENLPAVDDSGNSYYYYVYENAVPAEYEVSYSRASGTDTQEVVVTNRKPTTITIQKEWVEGDTKISDPKNYAGLPNKISVEVYQRYLHEEHTEGEDVPKPDSLKMVALGDSITNGSYQNLVAEQYRYWYRLRERLQSDGYSDVSVLNYGVDGNEIADMQARLNNIDFTGVNAVTLIAGTNDVMHGKSVGAAERYKTLVESIYAKAQAANIEGFTVYAATIPNITRLEWFQYPDSNPTQARADELVANYNTAISNLWDTENTSDNIAVPEGYSLVPVNLNSAVTVTDANHQAVSSLQTMLADGCHPNEKGYEAIAKAFNQAINSHYTNATVVTVTNPTNVAMPQDSADHLSALTTGTPYGTYELLKSSGYRLELKNLPKRDILGNEYVYYVKELGTHVLNGSSYRLTDNTLRYIDGVQYVDNGLTAISDDSVTIRNTIKTTELHIEKTWSDGNENHAQDEITVRIHRDTIADSANAQKNPLTLTLNKNEVTLYKDSGISVNLTATVPVKPVTDDRVNVVLDASMQRMTLTAKPGAETGDRVITFESEDGQTAELTVHIVEKPALTLVLDKTELSGGDAAPVIQHVYTITDDEVKEQATYRSSNENVISITSTGEMAVNGVGTAVITASYDGKEASETVTVNLPETFNIIGDNTVDMTQTIDLDIDKPYGTFTWSSGNDGIATVDSDGRVTGVTAGIVTITATRNDNVTADYEVTVQDNTIPTATWNGHTYGNNDLVEFTTADHVVLTFNRDISSVSSDDGWWITAEQTGIRSVQVGIGQGGTQSWAVTITVKFSDGSEMKLRFTTSEKKVLSVSPMSKTLGFGESVTLTPSDAEGDVTYSIVSQKDSNQQDITGLVSMSGNIVTANSENKTGVSEILVTDGVTEKIVTITVSDQEDSGNVLTISDYVWNTAIDISSYFSAGDGNRKVPSQIKVTVNGSFGFNYQIAASEYVSTWSGTGAYQSYWRSGNNQATIDVGSYRSITTFKNATIKFYDNNTQNVPISLEFVYPDSVNQTTSLKTTRFTASSLRMSKAKLFAAELTAAPEETQTGITTQEQQSMETVGYFDRTIRAADNWQISLSGLPQYFVKADGTVASCYYWAEEISGAEGYKVSYSYADGDDNTSYSINAANSGSATVSIKNTQNQLPDSVILPTTGSTGTRLYFMTGGVLLLFAAAGYCIHRRRRWSDE